MKHSLKTTVMALAAMFAFNTVADAQISVNGVSFKFGKKKKTENTEVKAEKAPSQEAAPASAPKSTAEMVTFDGKDFTVQHPKEYADVIDDWTPGVVNEWKKDDKHTLTVWPDEYSEIKEENLSWWANEKKDEFAGKDEGWKVDEPVINKGFFTIRMVAGDVVQYYYFKIDKMNIDGKMTFLVSEEAKYKPVFDAVVASIKKK